METGVQTLDNCVWPDVIKHNTRAFRLENPKPNYDVQVCKCKSCVRGDEPLKVYGPFLVVRSTVTETVYPGMLENFLVAQQDRDMRPCLLFQEAGAPPLLIWHARNFFDNHCARKSTGGENGPRVHIFVICIMTPCVLVGGHHICASILVVCWRQCHEL